MNKQNKKIPSLKERRTYVHMVQVTVVLVSALIS
jgi:hypothetical protein